MPHGYSVQVLGNSYLITVVMPLDGMPSFCEFKRIVAKNEEVLGKDGWDSPLNTEPSRMMRDQHESSVYFTYFLDECAGENVRYYFRWKMHGIYSPWREVDALGQAILPAPKNLKALRKHGHNK